MEIEIPAQSNAGGRRFWHFVAADLSGLALLGLLALGVGLLTNGWRHDPLPLRYESAAARLRTAVASLTPAGVATHPVRKIGQETFRRAVESGHALILDARPDVFYRLGHVPGAYNLSRESFAADYEHLRPHLEERGDALILVYCSDPDCPDGEMVAAALMQLGFEQVASVPSGWEGWTSAGLPEEKETP